MKNIFKITVAFMVVVVTTIVSCSSEDSAVNGSTYISYVRVTDPLSADSLVVSAGQGKFLALVGDNLQNTVQVWFNDQQTNLKPTLVSKKTILVSVPKVLPSVITNKIRLVNSSGGVYTYDFKVDISEPSIKRMVNEFTPTDKTAVIQGDYFYEPLTVTFTGGVTGTVSSVVDNKILNVIVPAGALPGPITVTSNFGSTISDFYFRDNRNILIDSDPFRGGDGSAFVVNNPGINDPVAISGNYIRVKKPIGDYEYTIVAEGTPAQLGTYAKSIPDDAILHPEKYNFKFEINTLKPYTSNMIKFQLATVGFIGDVNNIVYQWKPPYDTKGQWETVTVPFEDVVKTIKPVVNPTGYNLRFLIHGPGALDADISFDNLRVVLKELKLNK